jgi:hypothetical protein
LNAEFGNFILEARKSFYGRGFLFFIDRKRSYKFKYSRVPGRCLSPVLITVQPEVPTRRVLGIDLVPVYCGLDGAFGNNNALQMVGQCSLHLISKLRYDAALY